MYLVDTNVWLERLLDQEESGLVGSFLARVAPGDLVITDFSLHSIGIILTRLGHKEAFLESMQDVLIDGGVQLVCLGAEQMPHLVGAMDTFGLDFDDAYQAVAAERYDAVLMSLDSDLDRTARGRKTPEQVLGAH